jgi:hypothetical protein
MCLNLRIIKQKKKIKGIHVREEWSPIPVSRWYDPALKRPKASTTILLDLINTFSKVAENKINIQNM